MLFTWLLHDVFPGLAERGLIDSPELGKSPSGEYVPGSVSRSSESGSRADRVLRPPEKTACVFGMFLLQSSPDASGGEGL